METRDEIELFIFDLDGTLADSSKDLTNALNHALVSMGMEPANEDNMARLIGTGLKSLFLNLADNNKEKFFKAFTLYLEHMEEHLLDNTIAFPGVVETLSTMKQKKAIVTNKFEKMATRLIEGIGLLPHIDLVVGADTAPKMKPDPVPILHALERFDVSPSRAVMVGDTMDDIRSAEAAGVISCGVDYGFGMKEDLEKAGAKVIISSFPELSKYFGLKT